jgi:hypothetical protein
MEEFLAHAKMFKICPMKGGDLGFCISFAQAP